MDEQNASRDMVSAQDILMTEVIVNQALIDILIAKQIITENELVNSIENIRQDQRRLLKLVK